MRKSSKCAPEAHERAVRMVQEHRGEYPSMRAAIESIAPKIGCAPQSQPDSVKQAEVGSQARPDDGQRIKDLEREDKELRRANEILPLAPRFSPRQRSTAGGSDARAR